MPENSFISETPGKEFLITKNSCNYYLTIIIIPALFLFFLALALIGRLDTLGALICFLFFAGIVYAYFGRYLARIKLFENKIEVEYAFPWNHPLSYIFDKLTEIDHKDRPWVSWSNRWYRSYQILYLRNDRDEVCQIRYNINNGCDGLLLEKLREKLI